MKFVEIKNVSRNAISINQVRGFRLAPGESMKVHPATAAHPAVRQFLPPQGSSLELVTPGVSYTAEVEPIAPAIPQVSAPQPLPVVEEVPAEVIVESVETVENTEAVTVDEAVIAEASAIDEAPAVAEPTEEAQEPAPEMAGKSLREILIEGPGVTESNVDAILEAFASTEALASASKDQLTDLGLSSSSAKKLISWAKQL
jgi:hypothetical protein